jgi:ribokinase
VGRAARELLAAGPRLVALGAGRDGDLVTWADGELLLPLLGEDPVDPTGAGDAYVAALTAALLCGAEPTDAAWHASAAAALTIAYPGGRPDLSRPAMHALIASSRAD